MATALPSLDPVRLEAYRTQTFRLPPAKPVSSLAEALEYVNERGFLFFWPVTGVDLPSLWTAVAGNRPVVEAHDDPGHITWAWKDEALDKRLWYYAKILRRKATFISLEIVPYFYALSDNYGSPEEDYLLAYTEGRLTLAAKQVYEALLAEGALDTISLRRAARLQHAKDSEFNRALEDLQADFKILPVGVAEVGAWRYAYRYDLTARHFPDLPEQARPIGEAEARQKLIVIYLRSVGAVQAHDLARLFGWSPELVRCTVDKLLAEGKLIEVLHPQRAGLWLALPELASG